jgi:hypothetical protein
VHPLDVPATGLSTWSWGTEVANRDEALAIYRTVDFRD